MCYLLFPKVLISSFQFTRSLMQGVQKVKCSSCGTMFMSETGTTICPSCSSEQSHEHREYDARGMMGGCGCGGHSH